LKAKVVVVGGGAMGTCIAYHAAKRCDPLKEPVILIERDQLGAGASGGSSGVLYQNYGDRPMAGMARDALRIYTGFEGSTGRSIGFRRTGVLTVAGPKNPAGQRKLEKSLEMQLSIGIVVERVEASRMLEIVPGIELAPGTIGAWEPGGGFVDPGRTIEAFATLARDAGAVTRIGVRNPTVIVESGRIAGVQTDAGMFEAPLVVLATGSWTAEILKGVGVVDLPLEIAQVEQLFLRMPAGGGGGDAGRAHPDVDEDVQIATDLETRFMPSPLDRLPVPHPVVFDLDSGLFARCEPIQDRTRVGRISPEKAQRIAHPTHAAKSVPPAKRTEMREALARRLPAYRDLAEADHRYACVAVTPDLHPVVGPIPAIAGLYVVAGFTGNDFQLAPSIGEGIAQMLLGEPVSAFDTAYLSPERFG